MNRKLKLDQSKIDGCRNSAEVISNEVQSYIERHTTVAVERTVCRLFGVDGTDKYEVPLPNVVVNALVKEGLIEEGVTNFFGKSMAETGLSPQNIAIRIAEGGFDFTSLAPLTGEKIQELVEPYVSKALTTIDHNRQQREEYLNDYGDNDGALLYVIVATGNIREDMTQAVAAAKQGADVIAVIRTTGQSLLDYVPYGETHEGFGGTYATQENFRLMREALDEVGLALGRYIRLCNYCSGLCMPEIAAMGAFERLDMMLNDALYGILFRDINMKRTLVDQYFSRTINAYAGVMINTGEDNYLTTSDAFEEAHTVLASQFINEQFALKAGLPEELMGLGHAYEMNPEMENSFVYELAQAQMAREIFPKAPLKYMPPTKYMTGDVFKGHVQNALFNMVTTITGQRIHLLGMLTEAIHTPFMSDRALAIDNARYIAKAMADFGDEIEFKSDGIMAGRASEVLGEANELLKVIKTKGLFRALNEGVFAGIKRSEEGGKGLEGVFVKSDLYLNPFMARMASVLKEGL